jgi:co-chaperonin GroES (HSP10)
MGNRLLVRLVPFETVTASGIILAPTNKAKQNKAIVESLGEGSRMDRYGIWQPWIIKEGDSVLLAKYAGVEVGEDHLIVTNEDVIAVIND